MAGFDQRAAPRPRWLRAARYVNEAVLPFYLLHEPVIVAAAWLIVRWPAPVPAKYAVLVIVSFAATLGLDEAQVRRFRVARLLSGMKPRIKPATPGTRLRLGPPRLMVLRASGWRSTPASPSPTPSRATMTPSQLPGLTSTVTLEALGHPPRADNDAGGLVAGKPGRRATNWATDLGSHPRRAPGWPTATCPPRTFRHQAAGAPG